MTTQTITAYLLEDIGTHGQLRAIGEAIPGMDAHTDMSRRVHTMFHKVIQTPEFQALKKADIKATLLTQMIEPDATYIELDFEFTGDKDAFIQNTLQPVIEKLTGPNFLSVV